MQGQGLAKCSRVEEICVFERPCKSQHVFYLQILVVGAWKAFENHENGSQLQREAGEVVRYKRRSTLSQQR